MEDRAGGTAVELSAGSFIASSVAGFGSSASLSFARLPNRWDGLAALHGQQNSLASLVHDARNMVAALDLYCDLLDEDGVLAGPFHHYAGELRLVAAGSRRLLEKMTVVECVVERGEECDSEKDDSEKDANGGWQPAARVETVSQGNFRSRALGTGSGSGGCVSEDAALTSKAGHSNRLQAFWMGTPIENLAEELLASQNLLSALAGPGITVGISVLGGQRSIAMTGEDLMRVLVNLVKNAAEAMSLGGHIQITLEQRPYGAIRAGVERLRLTVSDNGPGIPAAALSTIFNAASRRAGTKENQAEGKWPIQHRGLGLSIVRSIVLAAGGSVSAANRAGLKQEGRANLSGAEIILEFPVVPERHLKSEAESGAGLRQMPIFTCNE